MEMNFFISFSVNNHNRASDVFDAPNIVVNVEASQQTGMDRTGGAIVS